MKDSIDYLTSLITLTSTILSFIKILKEEKIDSKQKNPIEIKAWKVIAIISIFSSILLATSTYYLSPQPYPTTISIDKYNGTDSLQEPVTIVNKPINGFSGSYTGKDPLLGIYLLVIFDGGSSYQLLQTKAENNKWDTQVGRGIISISFKDQIEIKTVIPANRKARLKAIDLVNKGSSKTMKDMDCFTEVRHEVARPKIFTH